MELNSVPNHQLEFMSDQDDIGTGFWRIMKQWILLRNARQGPHEFQRVIYRVVKHMLGSSDVQ